MYDIKNYEDIQKDILDNMILKIDKREGSFVSNMISPVSVEMAKMYIEHKYLLDLVFIQEGFDQYLERRVGEFGVERKEGSKAVGLVKVIGDKNITIEDGTIITANELEYITLNKVVLSDVEENLIYVESVDVGYKYNLEANTEMLLSKTKYGIDSIISYEDFVNGVDRETDEELRERFYFIINNPSTSGNKNHYKQWALETEGIGRASVYPLWDGNGTVKVVVTGNNNLPVDEDILTNVTTYIEEQMPIGCTLTVVNATVVDMNVSASVKIDETFKLEEIKSEFSIKLQEYLDSNVSENEIIYSKIYAILTNCFGVLDCTNLRINNSIDNIYLRDDEVPKIINITLNEVT